MVRPSAEVAAHLAPRLRCMEMMQCLSMLSWKSARERVDCGDLPCCQESQR